MMDKPFSPSTNTPFKAENFYLQVIVTKLICKRAHISKDCNYTFGIFKGTPQPMQAVDSSRPRRR